MIPSPKSKITPHHKRTKATLIHFYKTYKKSVRINKIYQTYYKKRPNQPSFRHAQSILSHNFIVKFSELSELLFQEKLFKELVNFFLCVRFEHVTSRFEVSFSRASARLPQERLRNLDTNVAGIDANKLPLLCSENSTKYHSRDISKKVMKARKLKKQLHISKINSKYMALRLFEFQK